MPLGFRRSTNYCVHGFAQEGWRNTPDFCRLLQERQRLILEWCKRTLQTRRGQELGRALNNIAGPLSSLCFCLIALNQHVSRRADEIHTEARLASEFFGNLGRVIASKC